MNDNAIIIHKKSGFAMPCNQMPGLVGFVTVGTQPVFNDTLKALDMVALLLPELHAKVNTAWGTTVAYVGPSSGWRYAVVCDPGNGGEAGNAEWWELDLKGAL